jgi:hypothetical protein
MSRAEYWDRLSGSMSKNMSPAQIAARTWIDSEFKEQLLAEPEQTLRDNGIPIPSDVEVRIVENTETVFHLILTPPPGEIDEEHRKLHERQGGRFFGIVPAPPAQGSIEDKEEKK